MEGVEEDCRKVRKQGRCKGSEHELKYEISEEKIDLPGENDIIARYGIPVSRTVIAHLEAPVAWGPHTIYTAVATPLTCTALHSYRKIRGERKKGRKKSGERTEKEKKESRGERREEPTLYGAKGSVRDWSEKDEERRWRSEWNMN
ncbi:hypothetical protein TNCV_2008051 [Trichonephila clavipes]|nr:hypothetical protein TNCV_2008051 [Trichonephila clavipes]